MAMNTLRAHRTGFARMAVVVAGIALLAAACGGDDGGSSNTTAAAAGTTAPAGTTAAGGGSGSEVTVQGFAFNPGDLTVAAGTTVKWSNKDSVEHTVVGSGLTGDLSAGGSYEHTFDAPGTFTYACTIHPTMKGTITVT